MRSKRCAVQNQGITLKSLNPRNRNSISVIKSKFLSVSSMNTLLAILKVIDARRDVIMAGGLCHRFPWRNLPPLPPWLSKIDCKYSCPSPLMSRIDLVSKNLLANCFRNSGPFLISSFSKSRILLNLLFLRFLRYLSWVF